MKHDFVCDHPLPVFVCHVMPAFLPATFLKSVWLLFCVPRLWTACHIRILLSIHRGWIVVSRGQIVIQCPRFVPVHPVSYLRVNTMNGGGRRRGCWALTVSFVAEEAGGGGGEFPWHRCVCFLRAIARSRETPTSFRSSPPLRPGVPPKTSDWNYFGCSASICVRVTDGLGPHVDLQPKGAVKNVTWLGCG